MCQLVFAFRGTQLTHRLRDQQVLVLILKERHGQGDGLKEYGVAWLLAVMELARLRQIVGDLRKILARGSASSYLFLCLRRRGTAIEIRSLCLPVRAMAAITFLVFLLLVSDGVTCWDTSTSGANRVIRSWVTATASNGFSTGLVGNGPVDQIAVFKIGVSDAPVCGGDSQHLKPSHEWQDQLLNVAPAAAD